MKKIASKKSWISQKSLKSLKFQDLRGVVGGRWSDDDSGLNNPAGGGNG